MVPLFKDRLLDVNPGFIRFDTLRTLQVNLGNLCNMACGHCHLDASPQGRRLMPLETIRDILGLLACRPGLTLDITGGCPELNPHFRYLVEASAVLSPRRIVRCNLTILSEPGYAWLPEFFRAQSLVVVASLPCYLEENVDRQRGRGTYSRSLEALRQLNAVGYGDELTLNLAYNPGGDFIPGAQDGLEAAYKKHLGTHGIRFNRLYTLANAPIGRFRGYLEANGAYDRYLELLASHFNPGAAENLMCRTLVSVDGNGVLYNCDFNQALGLPITGTGGNILEIGDFEQAARTGNELLFAEHCYCCTAGQGSSCTGALAD